MRPLYLEMETKEEFISRREEEEIRFPIFVKILECLQKFNGKPISKRIQTHLEKEMPEYRFYYWAEHTRYRLRVSENKPNNYNKVFEEITLGYTTNSDCFSTENVFNNFCPSEGIGAQKRIEYWTKERKEEYISMLETYHSKIAEISKMKDDINSFRFVP
jgi:hypothetical protein